MIKKDYMINLIFSLAIIFLSIFSSYCLSVKVIGQSKVLMEYVLELRDQSNILSRFMKIAKKESIATIKKYVEATIDSMVKYDRLPLIEDVKKTFLIVVESLDKEVEVSDITIEEDRIYIECSYKEEEKIGYFIKEIKNTKYVEEIFKRDLDQERKKCILGIKYTQGK